MENGELGAPLGIRGDGEWGLGNGESAIVTQTAGGSRQKPVSKQVSLVGILHLIIVIFNALC